MRLNNLLIRSFVVTDIIISNYKCKISLLHCRCDGDKADISNKMAEGNQKSKEFILN